MSKRMDKEEKQTVDFPAKLNSSSLVENVEDQETARELSELIDKWGVVKWSQFRGNTAEFWKEPAVRNVSHAVQRNFLTKEFAALLHQHLANREYLPHSLIRAGGGGQAQHRVYADLWEEGVRSCR